MNRTEPPPSYLARFVRAARTAWTEAEQLLTTLDHPSVSSVRESLRRLDG